MLLGKRPRPPIKRTTSMTEITSDLNTTNNADAPPSDPHNPFNNYPKQPASGFPGVVWGPKAQSNGIGAAVAASVALAGDASGGGGLQVLDQRLLVMISPRVHRSHSTDFMETPHFLRSCALCRRRLVPNRDIYMYRGDSAFCSLECRQQQMKQDEKAEKCSKDTSSAARFGVSATGETVAAV